MAARTPGNSSLCSKVVLLGIASIVGIAGWATATLFEQSTERTREIKTVLESVKSIADHAEAKSKWNEWQLRQINNRLKEIERKINQGIK